MREGWVATTLGDVVKINPRPTRQRTTGQQFKYVDISSVRYGTDLAAETLETHTLESAPSRAKREILAGDVVVSTVRPNLRGMARVPNSLNGEIASTGFAVLRAIPARCTDGFVWALVSDESFSRALSRVATGSNYPAVNSTDISKQPVALPPLHEQRRIVDLMDSVDVAISAAQAEVDTASAMEVRINLEVFRPLLSGVTVEVSSLTEMKLGRQKGGAAAGDAPTFATVKSGSITSTHRVNPASFDEMPIPSSWISAHGLRPGDVVLAEGGTVGESAIWPDHLIGDYGYDKHVIRIRPVEGKSALPDPECVEGVRG